VLKETEFNADTGLMTRTVDYRSGHDQASQTPQPYGSSGEALTSETLLVGQDGHGSLRMFTDMTGAMTQMLDCDAYGQMTAL
jgi:hypothetical protein